MAIPVVVVHHGAPDWCARTVDRLLASQGLALEVSVVDNSGDLPADRLPTAVEVLRPDANLGYAGGANLGLRHVLSRPGEPPEQVVVCSHDVAPDPATLAALVGAMEGHPGLGVVGPRLTSPGVSVGGTWNGWAAFEREPRADDPPLLDTDWVSGTCLVARVACLVETGGFDEGFGSYAEDVDLCLRARDAGWRVACLTTAGVATEGSMSADRTRLAARNAVLLVAKRAGVTAAWRAALRYGWRAVRGAMGWLAIHHSPARRERARRYAAGNVGAVRDVLHPGLLTGYARRPGARVPAIALRQPPAHAGTAPASE